MSKEIFIPPGLFSQSISPPKSLVAFVSLIPLNQPIGDYICSSLPSHSGVVPNISYWFFKTMTGVTGVLLYCTMTIIFVFAFTKVTVRAFFAEIYFTNFV